MLYTHSLFEEILGNKRIVINTDDSLKYFFPTLFSSVGGLFQMIFPILTSIDGKDSDFFNSKISGLKLNTYLNMDTSPNAWTIPGVTSKEYAQFIALPLVGAIPFFIALIKICSNQIKYKLNNNKIEFNSNYEILAWQTKGLKALVQDNNLRFSIMLHEIGHWIKLQNFVIASPLLVLQPVFNYFPPFGLIILIITMFLIRANEWAADDFVKELGYGKQLAEALDIMGYAKISNASIYMKFERLFQRMFFNIQDVIERVIPMSGHPSMEKRITNLKESYIHESFIVDKIAPVLKSLISPIDKFMADNVYIFDKSLR